MGIQSYKSEHKEQKLHQYMSTLLQCDECISSNKHTPE